MIFEQKCFVDEAGRAINGRYPVYQNFPPTAEELAHRPSFFAAAVLNMPLGNGQMAQSQFNFEIPGETPDEAFANFATALEMNKVKAEAEMLRQVRGQQIIVPGGALPPDLRNRG